ncbi:pirin family protein [Nitrosomonas sp. HPC101]|uniref:pirin family protein n=1 Tax=Nitrosomonas sp. HPC101 TaxID=1658667 RepID=UPI00136D8364|nr:pirin family protein [Nitrosomonas sp. HPC101]MXS85993.1 pirin family protein [Nitrosomonas sp. HPC101]
MNTSVNAVRIIPATAVREGAGVMVHRTIGTPTLRNYDPFMLLDHIGSENPNDYIAGFPSHPHRGFVTFTYMLDGRMQHQDSMGNTGNLEPGAAQWMKAASGVIHSEMPKQENGLLRGFQLWINLPAAHKMDHPEYQEFPAAAFPVVETGDYRLKVLIGRFGDVVAPIQDDLTQVTYFDVELRPGRHFQHWLPVQNTSFIYVFEGDGQFNGQNVALHSLVTADTDEGAFDFVAGKEGARFIVVSGQPVREPIVQYGPFVMNTREEIDQALADYHSNQLVRDRAWVKRKQ